MIAEEIDDIAIEKVSSLFAMNCLLSTALINLVTLLFSYIDLKILLRYFVTGIVLSSSAFLFVGVVCIHDKALRYRTSTFN
ncbi:hypothetical protein O9G_000259 [Rozella allomycis CSF55]|uniref:Uncharacterized protein n=1 Tax=Rozella allomycis (strain CSF55) TaxID=988480 RepID=A0A075AST1_ROZAC|nr:hypothetical protein O9G_000259 [Rozella allomycis CSF55]|eukprot:EPZ31780.1 hypothetical protein O9G_000259 [Rozella allomycis CSF55]